MAQGTRSRTAAIALGATVLVHAGIAWWLLGLRQTALSRETDALVVTWIDRPELLIDIAVPAPTPPVRATAAMPPPARAHSVLQAVDVETPSAAADAPLPTAAALLEQAGDWARQQVPAVEFSHDPLRRRAQPIADGRFAMRRSITPADVARGIGQLFGGAGYTQDPCPQIRRNIANLGTGGDAELRAEEIRRLQQFCL
ncbi:hypothetical protein LDO31_16090 [Luteimonas sp. XNQY3]|nr:hypothetical protein [Luteimonas sp. XNQY3]MCD9007726.1 hypothetical protein [Luteimonas sp. XNQY3]